MNKVKTQIKKLLERRKVRMLLQLILMPVSWFAIRLLGLFDSIWYKAQYVGGRTAGLQRHMPLVHYLLIGRQKGLTPLPFFMGEYYDPHRWAISIIDPLLKYSIRKNTWQRPTSILFDARSTEIKPGVIRPPLSVYLTKLRKRGDAPIYFDKQLNITKNFHWTDIKGTLYDGAKERYDQYKLREVAAPITEFDYERQQDAIENYREFSFADDKPPLISIVMPAWNREELIKDAIESAQAQTYQNWELLITDDGSTDSTVDVIKSYQNTDDRVKLFTPEHGGVCKARNHSIEHASGSLVAFLDSDNTWTPDILQTSVAMLLESDQKASYAAIKMDNNGQVRYRVTEPDPSLLETGNYIDLNALIVSKKTLDKAGYFDESLRRMVDYDLVCRVSRVADFIYVPIIGVNYTDHEDLARITTTEPLSWDGVIKNNNFIDWQTIGDNRDDDLVSIIVPVRGAIRHGIRCMNSILETIGDRNVEIIIVDASSNSALNTSMKAFTLFDERITYYREPACREVVLATNYGFARSRGRRVVVVNQHVTVESDWLDELLAIDAPLVGPLQLQPSRTVNSAGVEFQGDQATPVNILKDHPVSDAQPLDDSYEVDALMNGCFAVNADTFQQLKGLNPLYDAGFEVQDLCLRLKKLDTNAHIKVAKRSIVVNPDTGRGWYGLGQKQYTSDWSGIGSSVTSSLWRQAGFRVVEYRKDEPERGELSQLTPVLRSTLPKKSRRWAIKISAPADERRFVWGDMYYAQALAAALERQGQRVAIDYHDYHQRPTSYLDDVLLDLRGLDDTQPQDDAINIMWVISHPEKVTPEIVRSFDKVYAAGDKWAKYISEKSGKDVEFLPQCTDPNVFHPTEVDDEFAGKALFVGNSRNIRRPVVVDAIAAGLDVAVYGGGWEGLIDEKYIKGTFIPNDKLAQAYSSAEVVLNDHWVDMRDWGFISNRIFDASAAGACVLTDDIENVNKLFGIDTIRTYESVDDMRQIMKSEWGKSNMAENERQQLIENVETNHSFDTRAQTLIDSVKGMME